MGKNEVNFSGRSHRTCLVKDIVSGRVESGVLAGRVVGILDGEGVGQFRGFVLQDDSGRVSVQLKQGDSFPEAGDIIEIEVRKSDFQKNDETLVKPISDWVLLVKCEDFFIPVDAPNYLRSIVDLNLKEKLKKRSLIISEIRKFFEVRGFLEIETPLLVKKPGQEPHLDLFSTEFVGQNEAKEIREKMYLITSPEYSLKKYLAGGFEKIFQISKSFRNKETFSKMHNPEFTLLEWYRAYASYLDVMDDTEELFKELWLKFRGGEQFLNYGGCKVDVLAKWERLSVVEAMKKHAGVSKEELENVDLLRKTLIKKGYNTDGLPEFEDLFFKVFLNEVEPFLGKERPLVLFDYPASMAALSRISGNDKLYAERFEVYIAGVEICNAFSELNNAQEQKKRLEEEKSQRAALKKDVYDIDDKFIEALKIGMPPSGGNALGVDRLVMLLLEEEFIETVLPIPYKDL